MLTLALGALSISASPVEEISKVDLGDLIMRSMEIREVHSGLGDLVMRSLVEPELLAKEFNSSELAALAPFLEVNTAGAATSSVPVVVAHGMGDSCFNPGMKSVTNAAGTRLGVYSVCIPTGDSQPADTINGFLLSMDKSVEVFAAKVKKDPKLAGGFNAFGLSQGNNLIRGYIAKYNDPPVKNFMSICGINAGVGALPECSPQTFLIGGVCKVITSVLGDLAYHPIVQNHLFQANYFRAPSKISSADYLANSQLARWNGETSADMTAEKANWAKTDKFIWVMGTKDTVVWPRSGEQWEAVSKKYPKVLTTTPYNQTDWYTGDTFGLKTADEAGKNAFESFAGNHIRFTMAELNGWLDKYFAN